MDTITLIADAKARFSHNSAKDYLREKYYAKLLIAEQGGLWRADPETINILSTFTNDEIVLVDTFNNPVKVNRIELKEKLCATHESVMEDWYNEWLELESKR